MIRVFVLPGLFVVSLTGAALAVAHPAHAVPLCEQVSTGGTVVGLHSIGACPPYGGNVICTFNDAGLDPSAHVYTEVCIPEA